MEDYPLQCDECGLGATIPFEDGEVEVEVEFDCPRCGYEMLVDMTLAWAFAQHAKD